MGRVYGIGSLLLFGLELQIYFIAKLLKGAVVLGFFPALVGSLRILRKVMEEKDVSDFSLLKELKKSDKKEFLISNQLGWAFAVLLGIQAFNLQFSQHYFNIRAFQVFTVVLLALAAMVALYIFPLVSKYDLTFKQYVLQAFLCSVVGILETLAIFIGMSLAMGLGIIFPPIGFFTGISLMLAPYAWFSIAVMRRFENLFYKVQGHEEA